MASSTSPSTRPTPGFGYDALVTLALAHLQQGEVDEAMTYAEQAVAVIGPTVRARRAASSGRPVAAVTSARHCVPLGWSGRTATACSA